MGTGTSTDLTATELAEAYGSGELSPVQATTDALAAIEARDGETNAFCLVDAESALAAAALSEQRWRAGRQLGALDGVPTSIKDLLLTKGWPTLRGSRCVDREQDWDVDSPIVARLREAGAVLIGKTNTPELGWKGVTDNPLTGVTRNPWDRTRTPGGSSGGSSTAVALGMGTLSVGTDGGGSIRIPASFCGVVGFKPTHSRVPLYPSSALGILAHGGPIARSVDDVALMMDALAIPDHRDPFGLGPVAASFRDTSGLDVLALRMAFSADLGYVQVDPEVGRLVSEAVAGLQSAGARIEASDPGFEDPIASFDVLWEAGAAGWLEMFMRDHIDDVDPGLRGVVERGLRHSAQDYLKAYTERLSLGILMGEFHTRYDVLITPTVPIQPFEAGHNVPPGSGLPDWTRWTPFTYPFNMTQQPAISVPVGFTASGLPVGLQIVGPRHSDRLVLAVAKLVEQVCAAARRPSDCP
ncbi:amidase [Pseudonocardia acaciae]|uniref:amidase n=1 Tax=Pseudonocardia acaciae TaxID=551276 RepID=UPI0006864475|nr:amidase [Pseudonocardia acaciae]